MRNKIIILMILIVPLAVFAFLQNTTKDFAANAGTYQNSAAQKGKLIKFYSPMCSECQTVGVSVKNAMEDYSDTIYFEEINVTEKDDKTQDLIKTYDITVVPTIIFLDKNGKVVKRNEGGIEENEIREHLEKIK